MDEGERKVNDKRLGAGEVEYKYATNVRGRSSVLIRLSLNEPEEMPVGRPQSHSKQHSKNCMEGQYVDSLSETLYVCDMHSTRLLLILLKLLCSSFAQGRKYLSISVFSYSDCFFPSCRLALGLNKIKK